VILFPAILVLHGLDFLPEAIAFVAAFKDIVSILVVLCMVQCEKLGGCVQTTVIPTLLHLPVSPVKSMRLI
jgi:hypothetical protein